MFGSEAKLLILMKEDILTTDRSARTSTIPPLRIHYIRQVAEARANPSDGLVGLKVGVYCVHEFQTAFCSIIRLLFYIRPARGGPSAPLA